MTWMPIPEFPGYWANANGEIKSVRVTLRPWLSSGYLTVGLRRGGKTVRVHVHRLVLMAFVGLPADRMDGCHTNGDPLDNHIGNLRWATRSENILDQVRHGRHYNARKSECPSGHAYTEANTYILSGGRRQCVTCTRARASADYLRKKAAS